MFSFSKRLQLAAISGGVVGAAVAGGFGPLVRYEAQEAAERYGATLEVESVSPTLRGVRLRGVDLTLAEIPSARVHLDEVEVSYGAGGRAVALRGGALSAVGPREVVVRQAEAWRSHHLASDPSDAGGTRAPRGYTELAGIRVAWQDRATSPTESASAEDLVFSRGEGQLSVSAGKASIAFGHTSVTVAKSHVKLARGEGGYRLAELSADGVDAELSLPSRKSLPSQDTGTLRPASTGPAPSLPEPAGRAAATARSLLIAAAHTVAAALDPDAHVRLAGLHARVHAGDDALNLGPGTLQISRADGRLVVELAPELRVAAAPRAGDAPVVEEALTFRLAIPLDESSDKPDAQENRRRRTGRADLALLARHQGGGLRPLRRRPRLAHHALARRPVVGRSHPARRR